MAQDEKKTPEVKEEKVAKADKKADKKPAKKADAKSSKSSKKSKKNPFKSIGSFFKSVKAEGKKVVWATPKDTLRNTIIVLIVVFVVGICIYGVDSLLTLGMKEIKNLATTTTTTTTTSATTTATTTAEALEESTTAETTTAATTTAK